MCENKGLCIVLLYTITRLVDRSSAQWDEFDVPKEQLEYVERLRDEGHIRSEEVAQAMLQVDQHIFFGDNNPYGNYPREQTGSGEGQPLYDFPGQMVAYTLEKLRKQLRPGGKALDINCGNGFFSVCMAIMVGRFGYVVGLGAMQEIDNAKTNARRSNPDLIDHYRCRFLASESFFKGAPEQGPYDAIHVGAFMYDVPTEWVQQLKYGGRMLVPVITQTAVKMLIVDKHWNGSVTTTQDSGNYLFEMLCKSCNPK